MVCRPLATVAIAVLAFFGSAQAATLKGVVTAVHDGDTFSIGKQRVRVFGVDAPELKQLCRADAIRTPEPSPCVPCGQASRDALAGLIIGKEVTCKDRGKSYDRVVGECSVGEVEIGTWLLTHGLAGTYSKFLTGPLRSAYFQAEDSAKREKAGIWAMVFIPPADWRNHKVRLECER